MWKYPAEFRNDAVELVRSSGRSFASVARELGTTKRVSNANEQYREGKHAQTR